MCGTLIHHSLIVIRILIDHINLRELLLISDVEKTILSWSADQNLGDYSRIVLKIDLYRSNIRNCIAIHLHIPPQQLNLTRLR